MAAATQPFSNFPDFFFVSQRTLVKNAAALVASAAQYALTITLPFPAVRKKDCFWHNTPMRRETQVNLLGLIQRVCRIYQASTVTVMSNRGLIAARSTTFGCAVCIADSISR